MIKALPVAGYTLPTAARLIGCHPKHVYRIVKRGDLETFFDANERLMVSREEVYAYMKRKGDKATD